MSELETLAALVATAWQGLISRYGLTVVDRGVYLAEVVISESTILRFSSHWSDIGRFGDVPCGAYVWDLKHGSRSNYEVEDLLWKRSDAIPELDLDRDDPRFAALQALAQKFEKVGSDILEGKRDWLSEYETEVGRPGPVSELNQEHLRQIRRLARNTEQPDS